MKHAILFDLDGTLVDSLADICGIINKVRQVRGFDPLPAETIRPFIGYGVDELIKGTFPTIAATHHWSLVQDFRSIYKDNPHAGGSVYPGVKETLTALSSRYRFAIATNKSTAVAEKTLEYYLPGIHFEIVAGPEIVTQKKPHPAHLLEVLFKMGVVPGDAWFVGDSDVDLESAKAAGVRFLAAGYGFGRVQSDAHPRLESFADILRHVEYKDRP